MHRGSVGYLGFVALALLGACTSPISTSDALRQALANARPGETVMVEAGTYDGPFEVPAGVTLAGAGTAMTRIVAPAGPHAVRLQPGDSPTTLRALTVIGLEGYAVAAIGSGNVTIEDVEVVVPERGGGLGVQDVATLELRDVRVAGPVTRENAEALPSRPTTAEHATLGVVVFGATDALLENVTVSGFAAAAMVLARSSTRLSTVTVHDTAASGVVVIGGEATLEGVTINSVFAGTSLYPAYGLLALDGAVLTTSMTTIESTDGLGLVQIGGSAAHDGLVVRDNAEGGVWFQDVESVEATGTVAEANGMAGVVVHSSTNVHLEGLTVSDTTMVVRSESPREVMVGDGVQVVGSLAGLTVRDATITNCGRIGLLLAQESPDLSTTTLAAITIESTDDGLGAVMQGGDAPGWDDGISRTGAASTNDAEFVGELDVVGAISPTDLPLGSLDTTNVAGAISPTD